MTLSTTPASIERSLTLDILRGTFPVGSHLPTVRELAVTHGVNPGTIQRVVARLETRGLVEARQGSGLRVNDPAGFGDLSLVPYWLEATLDQPARAAGILDEFLEVRRIVAVRLMVRHRAAILAQSAELGVAASRLADAVDLDARRDADLAFARTLLRATGNVVALGVLNTLARVLEELPTVASAMYGEPEANTASMFRVLAALAGDANDADAAASIEAAIAEIDGHTVKRFELSLHHRAGRRS